MKPLSLLPKYLRLPVAVGVAALLVTAAGVYATHRVILQQAIDERTAAYDSQSGERARGPDATATGAANTRAFVLVRDGRRAALVAVGFVVAVLGVLFALLVVMARRQLADIRLLAQSAERLASGDYERPVTAPGSELEDLAASLDSLRERLRTTTISRDYLDRVLASMSEALLIVGPDGRIVRANPAAAQLLACEEAALTGRLAGSLFASEPGPGMVLADSGSRAQEGVVTGAGGRQVPVSYTVAEIHDSDPSLRGFVIAARNITDRKIAEQRIRYLARIDALTKVPNRMQFQHLLQRSIARASRQGRRLALLYIDVDRFKDINDIHGHSAGDLCLETLTERIGRLLPESAVIGRFAGDEFGVILEDASGEAAGLAGTARSILREIAQPLPFHGQQIHMTVSIGIACYPADARNVIDLIRSADSALYHAKRTGGNAFEFFDPQMSARDTERLMLKSKLRRAYEHDELRLRYQPKIDVATGRVVGAEALVRWDLADHGMVQPAAFIPLAEESNLILEIGEWVLDKVCRDFGEWQSQKLFPGTIAVNLSLKQLRRPDFSKRVQGICRRHRVPPASLELEITESTLMEDAERTVMALDELYALGIALAIDDFGTGYSSLSALQKFPISTLKIDQSFVREVTDSADAATIVTAIIQMGHSLKLNVVAEGVETERQLTFLRTAGCDYVQGLLFGEPLDARGFTHLLQSHRDGTSAFARRIQPRA